MQISEQSVTAIELRMLLAMLSKSAHQALEQRLSRMDPPMSRLQYSILRALDFGGEQTLSDLSRGLVLDPSTLVPAVDKLEKLGLVQRARDPQDRRRVPLLLTKQGQCFIGQLDALRGDDPLLHSLGQMQPEQAAQLVALLRELVEHLPEGAAILASIGQRLAAYEARARAHSATSCTQVTHDKEV